MRIQSQDSLLIKKFLQEKKEVCWRYIFYYINCAPLRSHCSENKTYFVLVLFYLCTVTFKHLDPEEYADPKHHSFLTNQSISKSLSSPIMKVIISYRLLTSWRLMRRRFSQNSPTWRWKLSTQRPAKRWAAAFVWHILFLTPIGFLKYFFAEPS